MVLTEHNFSHRIPKLSVGMTGAGADLCRVQVRVQRLNLLRRKLNTSAYLIVDFAHERFEYANVSRPALYGTVTSLNSTLPVAAMLWGEFICIVIGR